jgi:DNA processing protein
MQATARSGALTTARRARDFGRPVLAVPSPLGDRDNAGCLALLRDMAHAISTPTDVTRRLGLESPKELCRPLPDLPPEERALLERLDFEAHGLDELTRRFDRPAATVLDLLLRLELAGVVARRPGPRYVRLR